MRGREHPEPRRPDGGLGEPGDPAFGVLMERLASIEHAVTDRLTTIEQAVHRLVEDKEEEVRKEWYSTGELAEAMGVTTFTVSERWCNQGRIVCEKDPDSGRWLIPGAEYRRLVKGGALRPKNK
jgi:hypothetical protein